MKKILLAATVLTVMGALAAGSVFAADVEEKPYVNVSTKAAQEFAPNVANIKFYIETNDKDLNVATQKNKELSQKALEAVKKQLDSAKGDSVKTINFSASPEYKYKDGKRIFVQYNVSNGFQVTLKNTDKLGDVIAQGLQNGATRVDDLNFSLDNTDGACNSLIKEAAALSRTRAGELAKAAGSYVLGIKSINASCSGDSVMYPQARMLNSAKFASASADSAAMESSIPTELGTIKMYANVNANYFVK